MPGPTLSAGNSDYGSTIQGFGTDITTDIDNTSLFPEATVAYLCFKVTTLAATNTIIGKVYLKSPRGDLIDLGDTGSIASTGLYVIEFGLNAQAAAGDIVTAIKRKLPLKFTVVTTTGGGDNTKTTTFTFSILFL